MAKRAKKRRPDAEGPRTAPGRSQMPTGLQGAAAPLRDSGKIDWTLLGMLGLLLIGYVLLYDIIDAEADSLILKWDAWDSYSLQAAAWLDGRCTIDAERYPWLETAQYNGQYFLSFPPFPSLVMLPFVALFGENGAPSYLVVIGTCLASAACSYECFRKKGALPTAAAFWAVFYVMGSSMLSMSIDGGTWFMAQGMNLALATGAVWAFLCRRRALCLLLLSFAVGCRPFSACLLAGIWTLCVYDVCRSGKSPRRALSEILKFSAGPAAAACCYMAYNYVRFDNPFEFGHDYLPVFIESEHGQFDLSYILPNAGIYFLRPATITENGSLNFPVYDGFMFYLANPFFLIFFACIANDLRLHRFGKRKLLMVICFAANLLLILAHQTLGRQQFGARYAVDLLPYALLYVLLDGVRPKPNTLTVCIGVFAVMLNLYGAFFLYRIL